MSSRLQKMMLKETIFHVHHRGCMPTRNNVAQSPPFTGPKGRIASREIANQMPATSAQDEGTNPRSTGRLPTTDDPVHQICRFPACCCACRCLPSWQHKKRSHLFWTCGPGTHEHSAKPPSKGMWIGSLEHPKMTKTKTTCSIPRTRLPAWYCAPSKRTHLSIQQIEQRESTKQVSWTRRCNQSSKTLLKSVWPLMFEPRLY